LVSHVVLAAPASFELNDTSLQAIPLTTFEQARHSGQIGLLEAIQPENGSRIWPAAIWSPAPSLWFGIEK
jgi:hypothetical protein